MTALMGANVLAAILAAAFLQDLSYTTKTVLVSRGMRTLAMAADVFAMVASSIYLILTASVTIRSGMSVATVEAFAAIAVGGAGGTFAGMVAANWLERRFTSAVRRAHRSISPAGAAGQHAGKTWQQSAPISIRSMAPTDSSRVI